MNINNYRAVTSEEAKLVDKYTIEELGIPSLVLMERAAMSVCETIVLHLDTDKTILVVCGCGNNGGDGLAVARIMASKGYSVSVYLCENQENKGSEGYLHQLKALNYYNVRYVNEIGKYDCVVDAVFGIGLSRKITGKYARVIESINNMHNTLKVAVDCPSGVDCTTGDIPGVSVKCDITVTFGAVKTGLLLYPAADAAGKVVVSDIGFPDAAYDRCCNENIWMTGKDTLANIQKRVNYSNKGTYGRAVIVAGSKNMCGAAVMAAKACYSAGAGLVKVITCEENRTIMQSLVPEAILATYDEKNVDDIYKDLLWGDVILAGPGLATNDISHKMVAMVLETGKPVVLDADALNIVAADRTLMDKCHGKSIIITPHLGEMHRLCGKSIEQIRNNIVSECHNFAKENHLICVLKDARTIVSNGEKTTINVSGNSGMAKAGSGDVLAGIITALVLQGGDIYEKAVAGVYLHGSAGDDAAKKYGRYSMSPLNLIESISAITKRMEGEH